MKTKDKDARKCRSPRCWSTHSAWRYFRSRRL